MERRGRTPPIRVNELYSVKDKFTSKHYLYLINLLVSFEQVTPRNQQHVIETIRQLAELIIWGDQNNPTFIDIFLEKNVLSNLLRILNENSIVLVKIQLIQTLSILIENLKSDMALFYILSNNHINELITNKFDFKDEDLLANYISFLKTISLKLNKQTIQFFFNERSKEFPLYTEAIKFFNHSESMIRVSVRTLTLNVLKVNDDDIRHYLTLHNAPYFRDILSYFLHQFHTLSHLASTSLQSSQSKICDLSEELMDLLYYLHDIFELNIDKSNKILSISLIEILNRSLIRSIQSKSDKNRFILSFFIIALQFHIFTYPPLILSLFSLLFADNPTLSHYFEHSNDLSFELSLCFNNNINNNNIDNNNNNNNEGNDSQISDILKEKGGREVIRDILQSEDDQPILAVLFLLLSLLRNPSLPPSSLSLPSHSFIQNNIHNNINNNNINDNNINDNNINDNINNNNDNNDNNINNNENNNNNDKKDEEEEEGNGGGASDERAMEDENNNNNNGNENEANIDQNNDDDYNNDNNEMNNNDYINNYNSNNNSDNNINNENNNNNDNNNENNNNENNNNNNNDNNNSDNNNNNNNNNDNNSNDNNDNNNENNDNDNNENNNNENNNKEGEKKEGEWVVEGAFTILYRADKLHTRTVLLSSLLLKHFFLSLSSLSPSHLFSLSTAYKMARLNLKERFLYGEMGEEFLEMFEEEVRNFKVESFQSQITNPSAIFNLLNLTAKPPIKLSEEISDTKKAIQQFLLIRELKYSLTHKIDRFIPFRERSSCDVIELDSFLSIDGKAIEECEIVSRRGVGSRVLLIESPYLVVGELISNSKNIRVQELLDLQHIEVAISKGDQCALLTKIGTMTFPSEEQCSLVKIWIETAKKRVRQEKIFQLFKILDISPDQIELLYTNKRLVSKREDVAKPALRPRPLLSSDPLYRAH